MMVALGCVVIGRNEGSRLAESLESVIDHPAPVVYVDSGSIDGSVQLALSLGVDVIDLDPPFTAARARNAGLFKLVESYNREYVQFLDGDTVVDPGWLRRGLEVLRSTPSVAAVCGRLRERDSGASVFKRLLSLEWDRPTGEVLATGGTVMVRVASFQEVGGFNGQLLAGEEPELCLRLRERGWKILRVESEMAEHDAGPFGFRQWCQRALRCGAASAAALALHWPRPYRREVLAISSSLAWGCLLPIIALGTAPFTPGLSVLLLTGYPLQTLRLSRNLRLSGRQQADARLEAIATLAAKPAQTAGIIRYAFTGL